MQKLAFVFPGQGSQSVGMMAAYGDDADIRATFDEASAALGEDLWAMAAEGPAERLSLTTNTQPLMLTAGVAVYRSWIKRTGRQPDVVAGHSLGEYAALVAAGVLALKDAVPLVRLRAQAMQEAVPAGTGAMAAVLGLDADVVKAACVDAAQGEVVAAVNFNSPEQTVIAGHAAAVQRAMAVLSERGAKRTVALPVSAPFHCSLMQPAADRLAAVLPGIAFARPQIALVNNVDVATPDEADAIRDALVRQAAAPVRWVEVIQRMAALGVTTVAECGPGKVLAGLTKRIDRNLNGVALADAAALDQLAQQIGVN
ncbi:malonyl-CoA-acyl-carrier-protein transacylase [Methyloversatilis universalis FAM5]|uniref:Malonyl CoA-acyl carrier protein transacylase n=1 Tax=Methyloversatilis universalis (strain ATCC BAA-1314 / DSM 25237 / JCM 13912 / CCUG 52030 / FAM5) TaxID=1000565 RepID=F5R8Q4_METUF|nr:ACP S-malonyltransferase [Methyloversatilis universalis]EGK72794.1 malonyl-CoA-acyl-carrier-protein transacylase [Methyloversatilis universalis FAM5]